jgi:diguanylate cyclase (GGDEF)-like protein/PAS domain S-box-containing protein
MDVEQILYRTVMERAAIGILTTDVELRITGWNRWLETHSGLSSAQMLGRFLFEAFPDITSRRLDRYYHEALAGHTAFLARALHGYLLLLPPPVKQSGSGFMPQSAHIIPLMDGQQVHGTVTIIEDATEHVVRDTKLRDSVSELEAAEGTARLTDEHLQTILEQTSDTICILDTEGTVNYISPSVERNLGYQPSEWIGRNVFHIIHADDLPIVIKSLQASQEMRQGASPVKFRIRHRDGTWRTHEATGRKVVNTAGNPIMVISTRDISMCEEAQRALAHEVATNAALARLSTALLSEATIEDISHDLLAHAQQLTESPHGFVGYLDDQSRALVSAAMSDGIWESCSVTDKNAIFAKCNGLWAWVLAHHRPLLSNQPLRDPRSVGLPPGHMPIERFLSVPAMIGGKLVGLIALANSPRDYSEQDAALVTRLATIGAIAFQNRQAQAAFHEERDFVTAVLDTAGVLVVVLDREGLIERFNRACEAITGYSFEEVRGKHVWDTFTLPEEKDQVVSVVQQLQNGRPIPEIEHHWVTRSGEQRLIAWSYTVLLDDTGLVRHIIKTGIDVTERRKAEQALQTSTEKLTAWVNELEMRNREITLLNEMTDLLQTCIDVAEAYTVVSQSLPQIFTTESGALYALSESHNFLESVASWGDTERMEKVFRPQECWALRRGRLHVVEPPRTGLQCSHVGPNTSGTYLCMPMMAQGEAVGLLHLASGPHCTKLAETKQSLAVTVTEHIALALANLKLRETLRNQSVRDPLTGLFNRRYMEESLERELSRAKRNRRSLGVVMIDIDHFKHFNDTYGHEAGDTLLRELGSFLQSSVREGDIACRYGGEEFLLILPEVSITAALHRADQMREEFRKKAIRYSGKSLGNVTLSFGVALFPTHADTVGTLLRVADQALYRAKGAGRDRVETASSD